MNRTVKLLLTILVCLSVACQNGPAQPKKHAVSGTVTLDGKPLSETGMIYFKTIATGDIDAMEIKDGKFSGSAIPGERRVEIVVYRVTMQDLNGMKGEVKENLIPPRYNSETTLTAKVTPEGPNQFSFELTSK